jgi:glycosyltransferase involved in cell wall biosynthesis
MTEIAGMKTVFFFRRANAPWHHSIEELFGTIINALPMRVTPVRYVMKKNSTGLWNRIYNTLDAAFHQGEVNHITGDVHYIAAFMKKRKTSLTIHDMRILLSGSRLKVAVIRFFWFTMPSWRVRYITVISEFSKKEMIRLTGIPSSKILVVHDCVSPDIEPAPREFSVSRPVILNIGTTPNKNLDRVIPALEGMEITLVIIGKLNQEQVELLVRHRIRYENYFNLPYEQVLDNYRRSDIIMFASTYEGFGLPILEANSIGRPVIAGNNSSLPEVAGNAALLVDAGSVEAIRLATVRLINEPELRSRLISNGFENIKRFHPATIGEHFASLYEQLMKP